MEPTEYPPMSGSNTICTVTVLLETGMLPMVEPVSTIRLDAPGGVVVAQAFCEHGRVKAVELENVPCFAHTLGARLDVSGFGQLEVDVAYGGMFYAIVNAADLGLELVPKNARAICEIGEKIRLAAREQLNIIHPENPEIRGVSIVHVCNPLTQAHDVVRGATVIAPGRLDRSPTGTALSARLAVLHAKGSLQVGQGYTQESVIGSRFDGRIVRQTQVGHVSAIVPSVRGRAWITGTHQYLLDPEDPFAHGFVLSDTWGLGGGVTQS
jgi:proline racemase